jgi:protein O-GlcNAc transferase
MVKKSRLEKPALSRLPAQLADARRLVAEGKLGEAVAAYDRLVASYPVSAEAHFNRAVALFRHGQADQAIAGFRAALSFRPKWTEALLALGQIEFRRGRYREAESSFTLAAEIAPKSAEALCNLGLSQLRQRHPKRALPALKRSRELAPEREEPWVALRNALNMARFEQEALADFLQFEKRAKPSAQLICAALESARMTPGDELERRYLSLALTWNYDAADLGVLAQILGHLAYYDVPREAAFALYRTYDRLAQASRLNFGDVATKPLPNPDGRLRIGYLSADIRNHVMGRIMEEMIQRHDAGAFEVYLYSLAPLGGEDALTERLIARTCGLKRLIDMFDYDAARAIAEDHVHVLVDLMGHTSWSRPGILLFKPAPVVVTHLGFHGTVGLSQVDFKITDAIADLPDAGNYQIERPLSMSGSIIPIRQIEGVRPNMRTTGDKIVFGAFVGLQKLSPRCLAAWKQILDRVPDSLLVFSPDFEWHRPLYLRRLEHFGIDPQCVGFLPRGADEAENRARYAEVDVMLDTFPYTGGDSAACSMAEGVPLVTLCGQMHPERVATSVMTHLGIIDTIAQTEADYVEIAVRLAQDRSQREVLATRIRAALPGNDVAMTSYTRSFEAALHEAWRLRQPCQHG